MPGEAKVSADNRAMRAQLWTLAVVAGLLSAPIAFAGPEDSPAATENSDPFPITVSVTPNLVFVAGSNGVVAGRKVSIAGDTLPAGTKPVTITIGQEGSPPPRPRLRPTRRATTASTNSRRSTTASMT